MHHFPYPENSSSFQPDLDLLLPVAGTAYYASPSTNHALNLQPAIFNPSLIDEGAEWIFNPTNMSNAQPMDQNLFFDDASEMIDDFSDEIQMLATSSMYCAPNLTEIEQDLPPKVEKTPKKKSPESSGPCPPRNWMVRDAGTGKYRPPLLHEFLRELLDDPNFAHIAEYVDCHQGTFKFYDKDQAAKLWQEAKGRNCESG